MAQTNRYHGGLVFFGYQDSMLDRFMRIVSSTLEDYGHPVERQSMMNSRQARITASHYAVQLTMDATAATSDLTRRSMTLNSAGRLNRTRPIVPETPERLTIELIPADPARDDSDISELLMVVMLYRLVDICDVTGVEWLDPDTMLTHGQFMAAFTDVDPERVTGHQQILDDDDTRVESMQLATTPQSRSFDLIEGQRPHGGETGPVQLTDEEALALAFRTEPRPDELDGIDGLTAEERAQTDIRRLASWGMTGMLVFLSAPVAASLAAINLTKGEDFRLNTQVLSLTGLLVMLQTTGTLADVIAHLPI